jgi:hypothetical protein
MADIEVEVEKLRNATEVYHDEALKLLQLAEVAYEKPPFGMVMTTAISRLPQACIFTA